MIRALAPLLLLVTGCLAPGTYKCVQPAQQTVAVAVSTDRALGISHPTAVGDVFVLFVRGRKVLAKVDRVHPHGLIELVGVDGDLELQPGDSGSPVGLLIEKYTR